MIVGIEAGITTPSANPNHLPLGDLPQPPSPALSERLPRCDDIDIIHC